MTENKYWAWLYENSMFMNSKSDRHTTKRPTNSRAGMGPKRLCMVALLITPLPLLAKPNVVILLSDDLGWNDVGYHDSSVQTPNIDNIAKQGIELNRFYVDPTCSTSRASLMTGSFATTHGVNVPIQWYTKTGLPLEYKILPQFFKDAGYSTHLVGKWHLGHHTQAYLPNQRGFDSFYGFLGGGIGYYDHLFAGGIDWQRNGVTVVEEGYSTELITREATRVIEKNSGQPYFLLVAFNAPHTPIEGPGGKKLEHDGRNTYLDMVGSLDHAIGQIIGALTKQGDLTNTLVIFFSDNGGQEPVPFWMEWLIPPTADGFANNGLLRGDKGTIYEGGVRVPAAIWWPNVLQSEKALEQPLHVADLLPTLGQAIGFTPSKRDGESQWQSLISRKPKPRQPFIVANMGSEAMIDWPWKLAKEASLPFVPEFLATDDYYLYDLDRDPGETNDLAATHPKVFERMTLDLQRRPRRSVIKLDLGQARRRFVDGITRGPWAEAVLGSKDVGQ